MDATRLLHAYRTQQYNARNRGVPFRLTFEQWLQVWTDSGKLPQRGRGAGRYCMSRLGDAGAYEVGNVFIQLHTGNSGDGARRDVPKALPAGVCCVYPGTDKPYRAKAGTRVIGYFATGAEAEVAVAQYRAGRPDRIRRGRGWSFKAGAYEVSYRHRYVGRYATPAEANAAYEAALRADFTFPADAQGYIEQHRACMSGVTHA